MTLATHTAVEPQPRLAPEATVGSPRKGSPLSRSVAASLALHAAVGAFLFFGLQRQDRAIPPEQPAMAIEIMPAPSAPAIPPRDTPPGPQREENRAVQTPSKAEEKIPPTPVIRDVTPEVVAPPKQQTPSPPKPKPAAEETTAPTAAPAPPKPVAAAPTQGAPSITTTKAQQTWQGLVLAQIERKKHYPGEALRAGQQDLVYVHIFVDRTGRVLHANIDKSQHLQLLDNAALDAIRRCSPLPAPPPSELGDVIDFDVPIEFFINHNHEG